MDILIPPFVNVGKRWTSVDVLLTLPPPLLVHVVVERSLEGDRSSKYEVPEAFRRCFSLLVIVYFLGVSMTVKILICYFLFRKTRLRFVSCFRNPKIL